MKTDELDSKSTEKEIRKIIGDLKRRPSADVKADKALSLALIGVASVQTDKSLAQQLLDLIKVLKL